MVSIEHAEHERVRANVAMHGCDYEGCEVCDSMRSLGAVYVALIRHHGWNGILTCFYRLYRRSLKASSTTANAHWTATSWRTTLSKYRKRPIAVLIFPSYSVVLHLHLTLQIPMRPPSTDIIIIDSLQLIANIGPNNWGRPEPQALKLSAHLHLYPTSLALAAATDDIRLTVHSWDVAASLQGLGAPGATYAGGRALARRALQVMSNWTSDAVREVRVVLEAPKAHVRAEGGMGWEVVTAGEAAACAAAGAAEGVVVVALAKGLALSVLVGAHPAEREARQRVVVDMWIVEEPGVEEEVDYRRLVDVVVKVRPFPGVCAVSYVCCLFLHFSVLSSARSALQDMEASEHRTLERLVQEAIRAVCIAGEHVREVTIRARKPHALVGVDALIVQLTRPRSAFVRTTPGGSAV